MPTPEAVSVPTFSRSEFAPRSYHRYTNTVFAVAENTELPL